VKEIRMNRLLFVAIFLVVASAAHAQQQPSRAIDRVSVTLGQCVGNIEQRLDEIADLKAQLAAAQARISQLVEPKPATQEPEKP
jgi:uncharacterized protein YpuA (DUF1002 family)